MVTGFWLVTKKQDYRHKKFLQSIYVLTFRDRVRSTDISEQLR